MEQGDGEGPREKRNDRSLHVLSIQSLTRAIHAQTQKLTLLDASHTFSIPLEISGIIRDS